MPPRSIDTISVSHLDDAMDRLVWRLHMGCIAKNMPITDKTATKRDRSRHIRARYEAGEGLSDLARILRHLSMTINGQHRGEGCPDDLRSHHSQVNSQDCAPAAALSTCSEYK